MKALPPDIDSLLESERRAAPPEGAQARVQRRLEATLGLATAAIAGASTSAASTGAHAAHTGAALASKALAFKLVAAAVGAALLGGGAFVALRQKSAPAPLVSPNTDVPEARAPKPPMHSVVPHVAALPRPLHPHAPRGGLADEQAFLEEARAALRGGSPERALQLLSQHERVFPNALLGDARESLAIQALVAQDRLEAARARAAEFRRRYPRSLFQPAVDASLRR
jgi:hypothetical protein